MHLSLKNPSVKAIVNRAFPEWSHQHVTCSPSETVRFYGTMWDSGSRRTYVVMRIDTLETVPVPQEQFLRDSPAHDADWPIPAGAVIVVRCEGRWPHIELIAHPSTINPLLPATVELTEDERTVLVATRCLKSSYGGVKNFRFEEAHRARGITLERWDDAKVNLIGRGLLNKAGAITVDGRNAIGQEHL